MDNVINAPGSDGYVATGNPIGTLGKMTGTPVPMLGTDLRDDHPISIQYGGGGPTAANPDGAYTGALGYLNHNGDLDLNILIRTLVQDGLDVTLRAGAGIVADSVPERELAETRAKARGMLAALGSA